LPDVRSNHGRCYKASNGKNADEDVLLIHLCLPVQSDGPSARSLTEQKIAI
jgi:hypothetical protein